MKQGVWIKSRRSDTNACVEAQHTGNTIQVRDSKDPDGPVLNFTETEWTAFIQGVEDGDFDLGV